MIIEVRECDEVVFNGEADDFLFMQDNDIELENLLMQKKFRLPKLPVASQ